MSSSSHQKGVPNIVRIYPRRKDEGFFVREATEGPVGKSVGGLYFFTHKLHRYGNSYK